MGSVNLKDLVLRNYNIASEESIYNSHFPSLIDGNRPVNRAILLSLKDLTKGTTQIIKPGLVLSNAYEKYHLHKEDGIYRSIGVMSNSRLPLLSAKTTEDLSTLYDVNDGYYISRRYVNIALTELGADFVNSTELSPKIKNYDNSLDIPEVFLSLLPNGLFQIYWDIATGISTINLPLCPEEVFKAMKFLINNNYQATFEELAQFIKGFDTENYHTHITTTQNLYSLIEEGDCNTSVLIPINITPSRITITGCPLGRSFSDIAKEIKTINDIRFKSAKKEDTFTKFVVNQIERSHKCITIHYRPINNASIEEIRAELYEKTNLNKEYRVEYIGLLPSVYNGTPLERRLHKASVRELMLSAIQNGYRNRVHEINKKIASLEGQRVINELFEKITRPSTREWFKLILDFTNKEQLLVELANNGDKHGIIEKILGRPVNTIIEDIDINGLCIKGGITREEASIVFQKKSASMLARLDERTSAIFELQQYKATLDSFKRQLDDSEIKRYLCSMLDRWIGMPISKRRSTVLYKDNSNVIKDIKQTLISNLSVSNKSHNIPVYCITYKNNIIEFKLSLANLDLDRVRSIELFNKNHSLYIVTQDYINKMNGFSLDEPIMNNEVYRGNFLCEYNKVYLFVTNLGRVKLIHSKNLIQHHEQTVGLSLFPGETLLKYQVYDENYDFNNKAIEVLTENGIKRMNITDTAFSNKKGWKQLFSTRPTIVLDYRLIDKDDTNAIILTRSGFEIIRYPKYEVYKRNVSKEHMLATNSKFVCFADHKLIQIDNEIVKPSIDIFKKVLNNDMQDIAYIGYQLDSDITTDLETISAKIKTQTLPNNLVQSNIKLIY